MLDSVWVFQSNDDRVLMFCSWFTRLGDTRRKKLCWLGYRLFKIRQLLSYGTVWNTKTIFRSIQSYGRCIECNRSAYTIRFVQLGRRLCSYSKLEKVRSRISTDCQQWGMSIANSWRMSGDIYDMFTRPDDLCSCVQASDPHCIAPGTHCSVLNIINRVSTFVDRGQPGGWNDLDMLEVGNGGMTDEEAGFSSPKIEHPF